jgi:hypothetical protein
VIGVEPDLRLTGIARSNADTVAAAAWLDNPISVVNSDAVAYPFPPQPTRGVFLFNSFAAATLRAVVANLERSLRSTPRRLPVAYVNRLHREALDARPALWLPALSADVRAIVPTVAGGVETSPSHRFDTVRGWHYHGQTRQQAVEVGEGRGAWRGGVEAGGGVPLSVGVLAEAGHGDHAAVGDLGRGDAPPRARCSPAAI